MLKSLAPAFSLSSSSTSPVKSLPVATTCAPGSALAVDVEYDGEVQASPV